MADGLEKDGKVEVGEEENEWVEYDAEFKPIEHPMEPLEEDQPVKCPMPDSSLLNEGKNTLKEPLGDEFLSMEEPLQDNEESIPLQADRKRHHKIHQDSSIQPPFWGSQYNIFQVFQQCKDFSS
ncbi:hypothetical protein IEQ34_001194 [Dendrobium chrysotoxum]|uniref:Uncharacterized protein n=1 Tax=Dendrobium chrysotoxum TaxID=161865 RepID=A0AAV7HKM0_DENCH|nr:hypothetical protein IEQ34_001194 [Dendrobium chrysotoxum]